VTIGVIRINPAMLKRDEKDLTKLDIIMPIADFKKSPTGKLDCSNLNVSLTFEGNILFMAVVSFPNISGAADISFAS
jgi:hypothetical protein